MLPLPQPNPADEVFDAPVARMGIVVEAAGRADIVAPTWAGDSSARLGDTMADVAFAWALVQALTASAQAGDQHLELRLAYGDFPAERAAKIAFGHVHGHLLREEFPRRVSFVFFSQADADLFTRVAQARREWMGGKRKG